MTGTVWDSGNKSANISLGRLNVVAQTEASVNGVWKGVRATTSQSSGKYYLEFTSGYVANNGTIFGFGNSSFNTASYPGNDGNSFGVQNQGSQYGLTGGTWQGWGFGNIIGVAIDVTNKKIWYRTSANNNWNNDNSTNQNPVTGAGGKTYTTTGALFPAWSGSGNAGADFQNGCVLNAGGFAFCMTTPSGFSAWDTGTPTGTGITGTSPTVWDSGNKNANVVLSGSNLVATQNSASGTWAAVRATTNYDSSLRYFEMTITAYDSTNGHLAGFVDASQTFANNDFIGSGSSMHSMGWQIGTGSVWWRSSSGTGTGTGPAGAVAHVIGYAIDLNRGLWWVKDMTAGGNWNNSASADPVTGVGGHYAVNSQNLYIGWSGDRVAGVSDAVTLNVGGSAFTGTAPTGFLAWDPPAVYTASVSESATAASTQAVASIAYNPTVAETLSATSTQAIQGVVYNRIVAETATAASTQSELYTAGRSVSESMSAADHFNRVYNLIVNEAMSPLERQTRTLVYTASVHESRTLTDTAREGIHLSVVEDMTILAHATGATNANWFVRVRETATAVAAFTVQNIKHGVIAETLHPLTLITQTTNGNAFVSITQSANARDTVSSNLKTNSRVAESMTVLSHQSAYLGPTGTWNLSVAESATASDSTLLGVTFSSLGVYFWGYGYFYNRNPEQQLAVWCAGLDCGDHPVNADGSVFVPWQSDPDFTFTPAWLFYINGNPPINGFGASACNIDLTDNNGTKYRVVVDLAIGLPYRSQLQTMRPNAVDANHSQYGPSLGETRRVHQYSTLLANAQGVSVGPTSDNLRPMVFRQPDGTKYLDRQLKTGVHHGLLDDDYDFDGMIFVETYRPYPTTIVSLSGFMKTFDRE